MTRECDLAIVGSGFGGSVLALIARRLGLRVVLLERGRHPRFVIGESSTPLAALLLEEIARRYDLPALLPFTKWGAWQRERPDVAAGLKRGFTFYHHQPGQLWRPDPERATELLVAASPREAIADTHWYRPDLDQALARLAVEAGAELLEDVNLDATPDGSPRVGPDGVSLSGRTPLGSLQVRCRFVVDASGPRGYLSRALGLEGGLPPGMPRTQSLYTHFRGVRRWDELPPGAAPSAAASAGVGLGAEREPLPYPPDDAALHHVFPGGWIWVLRFNNGLTSAGVMAEAWLADELGLREGAAGWGRLLDRLPSVRAQFAEAEPVIPFRHEPQVAWRSGRVAALPGGSASAGWALLPSAAGFVDPLLSTGFPLTLLGVERLGRWLADEWGTSRAAAGLAEYEARTLEELDRTAGLIGALYANFGDFGAFTDLTLLYFAAASYAETARRLGRAELADGFLLARHPAFGPGLRECVALATSGAGASLDRQRLAARVQAVLGPVNVAGLGNPARRNWYPARADDLYATAGKLGVDRAAIESMLRRAGFLDEAG